MNAPKKWLIRILCGFLAQRPEALPGRPRSFLIIHQHDQLGDFLMTSPLFREIKKAVPGCRVAVVMTPYQQNVALHNPNIDESVVYQPKSLKWKAADLLHFVKALRSKRDAALVINTQAQSLTSDLIAYFSGARFVLGLAPKHPEYPVRFDFLYHQGVPQNPKLVHQSLECLSILDALKIPYDDASEQMVLSENEKQWAQECLKSMGIFSKPLIFLPGAGHEENRWPPEHFIKLGQKILPRFPLLVMWTLAQKEMGEKVYQDLRPFGAQTVAHPDFRMMDAVIAASGLNVCHDTGDLHISAALGAPTLGLFGPSDPARFCPIGSHVHFIRSPTGEMKGLSVDAVWQKVCMVLSAEGTPNEN